MGHVFTRRQLYELIWSVPIVTLAKTLRISDVGLAKACRQSSVPLPPRGYWAKVRAGKASEKPPLPLRAPGAYDRIEIGLGRYPHYHRDPGPEATTAPEPPVYEETEEQVAARLQKMVPKTWRIARSLEIPHPAISSLLLEDQTRRDLRDKSQHPIGDAPCFESRFEQRRLLFLGNLFTLLFQLDADPTIRGRVARETGARVGDHYVHFAVDALSKIRPRGRIPKVSGRSSESLAIEIKVSHWNHHAPEERLFWSDDETGKLEGRLRDIAVAIVLTGERQYRIGEQWRYEGARTSFEKASEDARIAREEGERRERERREQAEADRVTRLLAQIEARQQALRIRNYVGEVQATPDASEGRAFEGEREAWTVWALNVADRLDPLTRFNSS